MGLLKENKITYLGDLTVDFSLVFGEALTCLSKLYGISQKCKNISELRYEVWCKKMGKARSLALKNLPPT